MGYFKICSGCGRQVDLQKNFCTQCGSSEFIYLDNTQEPQGDAPYPQDNYTGTPYPPQYDDGADPQLPGKKGLQWWHILLMAAGVVVIVLLVVLIIFSVKGDKNDSSDGAKGNKSVVADADDDEDDDAEDESQKAAAADSDDGSEETTTKREETSTREETTKREEPTTKREEPTTKREETTTKREETTTKREESTTRKEPTKGNVAYSKGTVSGNVYTNEWANMKLVIPDGYFDANYLLSMIGGDAVGDLTDDMDIGLCLISDDFTSFAFIGFMEIPSGYDEESYLAELISSGDAPGTSTSTTIAGQTYMKFVTTASGETDNIYIRALDGHVIYIMITGSSQSANDALAKKITSVR